MAKGAKVKNNSQGNPAAVATLSDPAVQNILANLPDITDESGTTAHIQVDENLQKAEIEDLLDDIGEPEDSDYVERDAELEPVTEESDDEDEAEPQADSDPQPADEQKPVEPAKKEEPVAEQPAKDDKDAIIEQLRQTVLQLTQAGNQQQPQQEQAAPVEAAPQQQAQQPVQPISVDLTDDQIEEMMSDPAAFRQGLQSVIQNTIAATREAVLNDAVTAAANLAQRQVTLRTEAERFFSENDDLRPFRQYMQTVVNEVYAASPNKSFPELMMEAGNLTRQRLGLAKKAQQIDAQAQRAADEEPENVKAPKFAPRGGGRRSGPANPRSKTPQQKEIEDLIFD